MRVKRSAYVWTWKRTDECKSLCQACGTSTRRIVRIDTEPYAYGVVPLCMPCARHAGKAAGLVTPRATSVASKKEK